MQIVDSALFTVIVVLLLALQLTIHLFIMIPLVTLSNVFKALEYLTRSTLVVFGYNIVLPLKHGIQILRAYI